MKNSSILIFVLVSGLETAMAFPSGYGGSMSSEPRQTPQTVSVPSTDNFLLPDISTEGPQTRNYTFVVEERQGAPDGVSRSMLVVNGYYPGPTIHANSYDTLSITVVNSLSGAGTSIHWHGLYQNGTNYYDGTSSITQCPIPPNSSLTYTFALNGFSGTTWWHAHYAMQYTDGVVGALIVQEPTSVDPVYDAEVVVQMSDWYHNASDVLLAEYFSPTGIDDNPGDEPVPDAGVINGIGQYNSGGSYYSLDLVSNTTYRLRLMNTGSLADIRFSIDHHPLTVIAADSVAVEPIQVAGVKLAVAQRYDVLVTTNQTGGGAFWIRAMLSKDMFTYDQIGEEDDQRGILRYCTAGSTMPTTNSTSPDPGLPLPDLDTALLVPAQAINPPPSTMQVPLSFQLDNATAYINNVSWTPLLNTSTLFLLHNSSSPSTFLPEGLAVLGPDQLVLTVDSLQSVDIILQNNDNGAHPFHMHGHQLFLMASGNGTYDGCAQLHTVNPMRRDTHLIAANSWAILRFLTDNPGFWAFHCHIAWHASAGLLMQINSRPSLAAQFPIPQEMFTQCTAHVSPSRGGG